LKSSKEHSPGRTELGLDENWREQFADAWINAWGSLLDLLRDHPIALDKNDGWASESWISTLALG